MVSDTYFFIKCGVDQYLVFQTKLILQHTTTPLLLTSQFRHALFCDVIGTAPGEGIYCVGNDVFKVFAILHYSEIVGHFVDTAFHRLMSLCIS